MEKTRPSVPPIIIESTTEKSEPNLFEQVKEYVSNRIELAKIELIENSSHAVAGAVIGVVTVLTGLFILIFLSVGLGLYLGDVLDSRLNGFLIVAGIYLLLVILVLVLRKSVIESKIIDIQIKKFFSSKLP